MGGNLAEWQKAADPRLAHMDRVFSRFAHPGALPGGARPASSPRARQFDEGSRLSKTRRKTQ